MFFSNINIIVYWFGLIDVFYDIFWKKTGYYGEISPIYRLLAYLDVLRAVLSPLCCYLEAQYAMHV